MKQKTSFKILPIDDREREWVRRFITKEWGSEKIVARGKIYYPHKLGGFLAKQGRKYLGLVTYDIDKGDCHITTINSIIPRKGIGTALIEAVKDVAVKKRVQKNMASNY